MNNRKPKNNRGVLTRNHRNQYAPEAQFIKQIEGEGEDRIVKLVPNHRYPGTRRIVHYITPSAPGNLWGYTGQVI